MAQSSDERRRAMIEYLALRRYAPLKRLATEFCVSYNTVQRDIAYLSRYYPITTAYGRYGGGVYMMRNYHVDKVCLTPCQQTLLMRLENDLEGEDKAVMQSILKTFAQN